MRRTAVALAALASATLLAGCGTVSASARLAQWASANDFRQGVGDLVYGARQVTSDIDHHVSLATLKTDCDELFQQANGVNSDLIPTPDRELTNFLVTAVSSPTGMVHAAYLCTTQAGSASARQTVVRELHAALGAAIDAAFREEAVTGQRLSVPAP